MASLIDIPVCILASGGSRRFGSPKGLARLGSSTLLGTVIERVSAQTQGTVILNAAAGGPYSWENAEIVPDRLEGSLGPLAGVHAALCWSEENGAKAIATIALDVPFLPRDLLTKLAAQGAPAIASSLGRWHPVMGLWPSDLRGELEAYIASGKRSAHGWAEHCGAQAVDFPADSDGNDPFWNVNTPDDLAKANAMLGE